MSQNYVIRSVQPDDIPFIYSTWLKSYRHDSVLGRSMRSSLFFEGYREILDSLLLNSATLIACLPDEPDVILGYIVYDDCMFHYGFVKEAFRRMGIMRSLVTHADCHWDAYTHLTLTVARFIKDLQWTLDYNPLLLYRNDI